MAIDDALERAGVRACLHDIQTNTLSLLGELLTEADVVAAGPLSVLSDALKNGKLVEMQLTDWDAPLEPLGTLFRSDSLSPGVHALLSMLAPGYRVGEQDGGGSKSDHESHGDSPVTGQGAVPF
jgi:hypothetical protein